MIRPGFFGKTVPADGRRIDFDFANDQLLTMQKKPDILFIGDSLTQLWDVHVYFDTKKLLVNRGIGGDTSEYLLKRFDADVVQLDPALVIIMIGTNDISATHNDTWWRNPGVDESTVFTGTTENIEKMVEKCLENDIKAALCSILPSDIPAPFDKEMRWRLTENINTFIADLCKKHDLKYIDYHAELCMDDGKTLIADYSPDGIHVIANGYAVMANTLREEIDI
ncbi:MAG: hypothetical protein HQ557_04415 [Bacteroidetes bacterium]|nr:hypothetical protein [Bacteroidota bacterium]